MGLICGQQHDKKLRTCGVCKGVHVKAYPNITPAKIGWVDGTGWVGIVGGMVRERDQRRTPLT